MRTDAAKSIAGEIKYMKESFWTEFTIRACSRGFKMLEVPVTHRKTNRSTNVYIPLKIPAIALSQLMALLKLWAELRAKTF